MAAEARDAPECRAASQLPSQAARAGGSSGGSTEGQAEAQRGKRTPPALWRAPVSEHAGPGEDWWPSCLSPGRGCHGTPSALLPGPQSPRSAVPTPQSSEGNREPLGQAGFPVAASGRAWSCRSVSAVVVSRPSALLETPLALGFRVLLGLAPLDCPLRSEVTPASWRH